MGEESRPMAPFDNVVLYSTGLMKRFLDGDLTADGFSAAMNRRGDQIRAAYKEAERVLQNTPPGPERDFLMFTAMLAVPGAVAHELLTGWTNATVAGDEEAAEGILEAVGRVAVAHDEMDDAIAKKDEPRASASLAAIFDIRQSALGLT